MTTPKIDYNLLHSAVNELGRDQAEADKLGINVTQLDRLAYALDYAKRGFPDAFQETPDMQAQALVVLANSNSYRGHPNAAATLSALAPATNRSTWARNHPGGSSGILGNVATFTDRSAGTAEIRKLTPTDINFSNGFKVISGASKFVIPLGELPGAVPLVYPASHEKAGQPIADWQGKPIGERGIVFFNHADNSYQAAATGQNHVIIFNKVTPEQAGQLLTRPINNL